MKKNKIYKKLVIKMLSIFSVVNELEGEELRKKRQSIKLYTSADSAKVLTRCSV